MLTLQAKFSVKSQNAFCAKIVDFTLYGVMEGEHSLLDWVTGDVECELQK